MAYRDKPDIYGDPDSAQSKEARRYFLWILPWVVIAPNLGRIAHLLGFTATYDVVVFITIAMAIFCITAGILAYRNARRQAARDLEELTGFTERQRQGPLPWQNRR